MLLTGTLSVFHMCSIQFFVVWSGSSFFHRIRIRIRIFFWREDQKCMLHKIFYHSGVCNDKCIPHFVPFLSDPHIYICGSDKKTNDLKKSKHLPPFVTFKLKPSCQATLRNILLFSLWLQTCSGHAHGHGVRKEKIIVEKEKENRE